MPDSSSRKTCYWIREGKSFSSNGNQTVRKGSRFQFPVTYENSNFRLDWYALRVPIWTKAFPCPFNLDQQRLLEVKQLVWIQNIPLLQYEIQIDCETDKLRVQQRCTWLKYATLNTIYRYSLYVSHTCLNIPETNKLCTIRQKFFRIFFFPNNGRCVTVRINEAIKICIELI